MMFATATVVALALSVGAHDTATASKRMPTRITAIGCTLNGYQAAYERVTPSVAYFYGRGVVARLDARHRAWVVTAMNVSSRPVRLIIRVWPTGGLR